MNIKIISDARRMKLQNFTLKYVCLNNIFKFKMILPFCTMFIQSRLLINRKGSKEPRTLTNTRNKDKLKRLELVPLK